jgi:large subunit ribosomal protein L13
MTKTTVPKKADMQRQWHFINAEGQILGKVAVQIATFLTGKNKPMFAPNADMGDIVVVTNAAKVVVTGKKIKEKKYYHHTGFPGGLRTQTFEDIETKKPGDALRRAVRGMIPHNKLEKIRLANLHIYAGEEHPHKAQETK